jgi:homoserine O-succinyltransferase
MPIVIDEYPLAEKVLTRIGSGQADQLSAAVHSRHVCLTIGLVNNMPDSALEATEQQFLTLMEEAATDFLVQVKLFSIDRVPRGEHGRQHICNYYSDIRELWSGRLDGLIVTGTEPRAPNLADEPYWTPLTDLIDWAQQNTTSTVFSCLAAHAAVLHLDGINRSPLPEKCFGVFEQQQHSDHFLLKGAPVRITTPHSRWNELPNGALSSSGYDILTASSDAGADLFIRQGKSLFVFLQGHPEYQAETLWREYRRDVGRFLRGEQARYPGLPKGYFDPTTNWALQEFRSRAVAERREQLLSEFPAAQKPTGLKATWRAQAIKLYRNWFAHMAARRAQMEKRRFSPIWPASAALRPATPLRRTPGTDVR